MIRQWVNPDICEVFDGMFPPDYRRRLVFMLRAFVDASTANKPGGPPVIAIAGFVGTVPGWSDFQKKWREARAESGLDYFHMTDFMSRKANPYKDWSEKKREAVIGRLIELINTHLLFAVSASANLLDIPRLPGRNPYSFCACQVVGLVIYALECKQINEQVMWVFEAGDPGEPEFIASMNQICAASESTKEKHRIYGIMAGSKKKFPALDAADFFAWETPQVIQRINKPSPDALPVYVERVKLDFFTKHLGGEEIKEWAVNPNLDDIIW